MTRWEYHCPAGTYYDRSLLGLLWAIVSHRCWHWRLREQLATAAPVVPVVTEAQIEAVAKVLRQRDEGTAWCTWDTIKPQTRALYMDEARKILTAASEGQNDA
jgi:hypothetical protein